MKNTLLLLIGFVFFNPLSTFSAVRVAKISQFVGDVKVERNQMVKGARINLFVAEGDWIITGEESEAYLLLKSGSKLRIGENSRFGVNSCLDNQDGSRDIKFNIKVGSIICNIKKLAGKKGSFELATPTATCAIRGTVFETVVSQDGASKFNVLEGIIDVGLIGSDEIIQVPPNKQAKVDKNAKTITSNDIPPEEKAKLIKKAKKILPAEKPKPAPQKGTKKKEKPEDSEKEEEESKESEEGDEESEEESEGEEEESEEETSEEDEEAEEEEPSEEDAGPDEESSTDEDTEKQEEVVQEDILETMDEIIQDDPDPIKDEIPIEEIIEKVPSPSTQ